MAMAVRLLLRRSTSSSLLPQVQASGPISVCSSSFRELNSNNVVDEGGNGKRFMYTDAVAARVGRRPAGIPESQVDALDGIEEMASGAGATARMSIELKSFEKIRPGKLKNVSKVGLPTTRILFTFNRSPHVDKKSREQFEMKTRKQLLVMDMDVGKLREKYNLLKNHNMLGVQLKVNFHYKTRLDMSRIKGQVTEATGEDQQKQMEAKP